MSETHVEVLATVPPAEELLRELDGRPEAAFADGDVLTLVCAGPAPAFAHVFDARVPMAPAGPAGLQAASLRVPRLAEAVASFRCGPDAEPVAGASLSVWRGEDAPPAVRRARLPEERYERHSFDSAALGGTRELTVFRPAQDAGPRRVLFTTDQGSWAHIIEPLVEDGTVPPLTVVGVANAPGIRRRHEYVPGLFPSRFAAHRRFFVDELGAWAERELGASPSPRHRAVAGVSNGADFAAAIGALDPHRIGGVVALSCGMIRPQAVPTARAGARQWLAAGTLEPGFLRATRRWAEALADAGAEHVFRARVAAHDPVMWEEEIAAALPYIFPPVGAAP